MSTDLGSYMFIYTGDTQIIYSAYSNCIKIGRCGEKQAFKWAHGSHFPKNHRTNKMISDVKLNSVTHL